MAAPLVRALPRNPRTQPWRTGRRLLGLVVAASLHGCAERPPSPPPAGPVVAGLAEPGLDARTRGQVLLVELGCVACHRQPTEPALQDRASGPDLAAVGTRIRAGYLEHFLADPLGVEPGTPMPDLLRDRSESARTEAAEALAHYLRSLSPATAPTPPMPTDMVAAARGRSLFHEIGCVACHAPRDEAGAELPLSGSAPLGRLQDKYEFAAMRDFLLAPLAVRPAARMPDFHLAPGEARDLAHYLLAGAPPAARSSVAIDSSKVAAGRRLFAELRCAACHELRDPAASPAPMPRTLRELDPERGCLTGTVGPWPFYALTDEQRRDLAAALREDEPQQGEQRIEQLLASRNCTACHRRGERGGVSHERNPYFRSGDPSLGEDSRVPPTLTGVGAKLQPAWLRDAIEHGQSVRPYLRTRMPGFGGAVALELRDLLLRTDALPDLALTPLPEDEKQARAITDLGRELVSEQGMNCISCHTFAGEQVGTMGGIDLVDSTAQRLRPEWFLHFLRAPFRFKPGTLMPQFFVDGVSSRPALGGGDVARQTEAIWHYLAEGRNVGKPSGMRRSPIELLVGSEAVLLRRSVQNTGKRGISVGLPLGVNLTFDAERLGMNQIWWGRFVDAAGVWTGQGSGEARILGEVRATLPNGPAFAVLHDAAEPWPAASRRELGQQFLGYDLDAQQRPVFRYVCAGVTITDAPVELPVGNTTGETRPRLRRTLTFACATDTTLHFRAARDARIDDLGNGVAQVGQSLRLHLPPGAFRIRPAGEARELLVAIAIQHGRAELVVDYAWQEAGK